MDTTGTHHQFDPAKLSAKHYAAVLVIHLADLSPSGPEPDEAHQQPYVEGYQAALRDVQSWAGAALSIAAGYGPSTPDRMAAHQQVINQLRSIHASWSQAVPADDTEAVR